MWDVVEGMKDSNWAGECHKLEDEWMKLDKRRCKSMILNQICFD
jgi:hypothetical protein